jgi:hypothetical protein
MAKPRGRVLPRRVGKLFTPHTTRDLSPRAGTRRGRGDLTAPTPGGWRRGENKTGHALHRGRRGNGANEAACAPDRVADRVGASQGLLLKIDALAQARGVARHSAARLCGGGPRQKQNGGLRRFGHVAPSDWSNIDIWPRGAV